MNRKAVLPLTVQEEPPRGAFQSYRRPHSTCDYLISSLADGSFDYKDRVIRKKGLIAVEQIYREHTLHPNLPWTWFHFLLRVIFDNLEIIYR